MKSKALILTVLACAAAWSAQASPRAGGETKKTFAVAKGGKLEVTLRGGNIAITPWDRDEVSATVRREDEQDAGLSMSQEGNTVRIEDNGASSDDYTLEVHVPSKFDLRLRSSSGDFRIDGPLTGRIRGTTGGGNIRLGNLSGTIELTTSGGDITSGDIGGDLALNTSGGDIVMGAVTGSASVSTSGGEITIRSVGKRVEASSSGGNISIGDVGGEAVASTSGGDIVAGSVSGSATLNTSGGNVTLKGATGDVRASSSGGDLDLENITGSLEGTTAGGNVSAMLNPGSKTRSRLSTSGGDIRLTVPAGAKATISARIDIRGWWRREKDTYDIRSDFAMTNYEKDERNHEIHATILVNGGGAPVELDAVSGNIEVRRSAR